MAQYGWRITISAKHLLKGLLPGLIQFLTTENPLKMMKNNFYFTLKALFVLMVFKFLESSKLRYLHVHVRACLVCFIAHVATCLRADVLQLQITKISFP